MVSMTMGRPCCSPAPHVGEMILEMAKLTLMYWENPRQPRTSVGHGRKVEGPREKLKEER